MAIERTNSFHLMLSDDELALLRLLAEREGLSASDYLRTVLRREAGGPTRAAPFAHVQRVMHLLNPSALERAWAGQKAAAKTKKPAAARAKRKP